MLTAIETTATLTEGHRLVLDEGLPGNAPSRVRVIVLFDEDDEISDVNWAKALDKNEVFDFLQDDREDIYTLEDGKALKDEK